MTVREVANIVEQLAPLAYQESYDNSGLQVGSPNNEVKGILLCIDITPAIIDEAIALHANLIVSHHPLIFSGIKRLNGSNYVEQAVIKAIQNNVSIYSAHTNIDNVWNGVSHKIAEKMQLSNLEILDESADQLVKLTTFVPQNSANEVRLAMFNAGAGTIGNYDHCSYNVEGKGSFRAGEGSNPFVGKKGETHFEPETRIEVVLPKPILQNVLSALLKAHPYEEVAYDVYPLLNKNPLSGAGMIGVLENPIPEDDFLKEVKLKFNAKCIRHSPFLSKNISKVAFCGGSGAFLVPKAISKGADIFITADVKYHQFFGANGKIIIADIGHFESEQFTVEIFYDLLTKKISNFAVLKSEVNTNPINYI